MWSVRGFTLGGLAMRITWRQFFIVFEPDASGFGVFLGSQFVVFGSQYGGMVISGDDRYMIENLLIGASRSRNRSETKKEV